MFSHSVVPRLLNMSITASAVIVAVIFVRLLLKKAPRVISYALWGIVLIRLLCPMALQSPASLFELVSPPMNEAGAMEYIPQSIDRQDFAAVDMPAEEIDAAIDEGAYDRLSVPLYSSAFGIWLFGACAMLAMGLFQLVRLKRKVTGAVNESGNVYIADRIKTAFVMGVVKPRIYIPSALDEAQKELVLMHENRHIARFDHVIRIAAFFALCIHWFNPLVYLAYVLAGRDMELSCDEAVIKRLDKAQRADYSQMILNISIGKSPLPEVPVGFGGGSVSQRIKRVLKNGAAPRWLIAAALIVLFTAALILLTNPMQPNTLLLASDYDSVKLIHGEDIDLFGISLTTDFTLFERAPSYSGYEEIGFMEKYPASLAENALSGYGVGSIADARYFEKSGVMRLAVQCKNGDNYYAVLDDTPSVYKVRPTLYIKSNNGPFYERTISDNLNTDVKTVITIAEGDVQLVGFLEGEDRFGFASFRIKNNCAEMLCAYSYDVPESGIYYADDAIISAEGTYNVVLNKNLALGGIKRYVEGNVYTKEGDFGDDTMILMKYQSPYQFSQSLEFLDGLGNVIGLQEVEKKPDHEFFQDPEHPGYTASYFEIIPKENAALVIHGVENAQKLAISSVQHMLISHFDTADKLESFVSEAEKRWKLDEKYDADPSFLESVKKYDDSFFEEYSIILVQAGKAPKDRVLRMNDMSLVNGRLFVTVESREPDGLEWGGGTNNWLILIEVLKNDIDTAREFDSWREDSWRE